MPVSERPTREKSESLPLTFTESLPLKFEHIEADLSKLCSLAMSLSRDVKDLQDALAQSPPAGNEDKSDDESDDDDKNPHKIILSRRRTVDVPLVTVNPKRNSKMAMLLAKLASG